MVILVFLAFGSLNVSANWQLDESMDIPTFARSVNNGNLEIVMTVRSAKTVNQALKTYEPVISARKQGEPIDSTFLVNLREKGLNIIFIDGKLFSTNNRPSNTQKEVFLYMEGSLKDLEKLPKVTQGEVLQIKEITFASNTKRQNLLIRFENKGFSLAIPNWNSQTVKDLRDNLKGIISVEALN